MSFDYRFRQNDSGDIAQVVGFLAGQDLSYPGYKNWVERAEAEMKVGVKQFIAAYSDSTVVGDVVYQEHKALKGAVELKNIRIHPMMRDRNFARFMLRQVEIENPTSLIVVDAREEQKEMLSFLRSCGYFEVARASLYEDGIREVIMAKFPKSRIDRNGLISLEDHFRSVAL